MSPIQPLPAPVTCPFCAGDAIETVDATYTYQPCGVEGSDGHYHKIVSTTHDLRCRKCGNEFSVTVAGE
jgi:hypothetical protein